MPLPQVPELNTSVARSANSLHLKWSLPASGDSNDDDRSSAHVESPIRCVELEYRAKCNILDNADDSDASWKSRGGHCYDPSDDPKTFLLEGYCIYNKLYL